MKFTTSWLKDHLDTKKKDNELIEKLTDVGLEVESFDKLSSDLDSFKVAKIINAEQHPNADRLRICDVDIGHSLKAGEVFGLIRFGSRVDIYFPSEVSVMVLKGQKMIAGETIIGDFSKNAKPVKEITDEK